MLYCEKRKLAVFLNPKTGTQTIHKIFEEAGLTDKPQNHYNYTHAHEKYNLDDFKNYKFFCFYRDPVSRFESAIKFLKRDRYLYLLLQLAPNEIITEAIRQVRARKIKDSLDLNKKYLEEYNWLSQEIRNYIEALDLNLFLKLIPQEIIFDSEGAEVILAHQKHWLDHDIDIMYLKFSDYENELRKLLSYFELNIEYIPRRNKTIKIDSESSFSKNEVDLIKEIYSSDYEFLSSKGLL